MKHSAAHSGDQPILVTFKRKDQRRDTARDKVEIAKRMLDTSRHFAPAGLVEASVQAGAVSDVNLFEAPILMLHASPKEIERFRNDPDIAAVEADTEMAATSEGLGDATPQAETVPAGVTQIGAPTAWDASSGRGIQVAILDTGIDWTHPDLAANVKGSVSFITGETPMDGNGHGTHSAGITAAARNGAGIVGVAPAAWLYAVKVLSNSASGPFSSIISGINWCIANKMQIVSIPLGAAGAPAALETICNAAFSNGLLLIAPSGSNAGPVAAPARYKNVIGVSAVNSSDMIAPFTGRGPEIELCAPGVNVLSTKPGGGHQVWSGTAAACAHVAGAAALTWGAHRFATAAQIWNLLATTALDRGTPGWDPDYGYGRVRADLAALAPLPAPNIPFRP